MYGDTCGQGVTSDTVPVHVTFALTCNSDYDRVKISAA